jgi:hypothetical protein
VSDTSNFDWIEQYLKQALLYKRGQSGNTVTLQLHAFLLRALDLSNDGRYEAAAIVFCEALALARLNLSELEGSKSSGAANKGVLDVEELSTIADLCFGYARVLAELNGVHQALDLMYLAIRLYTRLYGIADGRVLFCASRLKELALSFQAYIYVARILFFLRAHKALAGLLQAKFLFESSWPECCVLVENLTSAYCLRLDNGSSYSADLSTEEIEDIEIVNCAVELIRSTASSSAARLVVFPAYDSQSFSALCHTNFSGYVAEFNRAVGKEILIPVRCEIGYLPEDSPQSIVAYLFVQKGQTLGLGKGSMVVNSPERKLPFKWKCSEFDDLCGLFNSRLRKLRSGERFYRLDNGRSAVINAYLYCSSAQASDLIGSVPMRTPRLFQA